MKISGKETTSGVSIDRVLYGTYYIFPKDAESNDRTMIIKNLQNSHMIFNELKAGQFEEWTLVEQGRSAANKRGDFYLNSSIQSNVIFKRRVLYHNAFQIELGAWYGC